VSREKQHVKSRYAVLTEAGRSALAQRLTSSRGGINRLETVDEGTTVPDTPGHVFGHRDRQHPPFRGCLSCLSQTVGR
jgi:hypothetical protein